jgi:hypothetical protein
MPKLAVVGLVLELVSGDVTIGPPNKNATA